MRKTVMINGQELAIETNALLPRQYRNQFGRDLIVDMQAMVDTYKNDKAGFSTEVLENITWLMMKEAGEDVGETPEEWLAGLDDAFAIYEVIGDVVELWGRGRQTTSKPKKK